MPGFHKFNKEFTTSNLNPFCVWFKVATTTTGAVGTVSQAKGNVVETVTRTGVGAYTVQLTRPYPAGLLKADVSVIRNLVTELATVASYKLNSYSATAGTFQVICSTPASGVAPAAQELPNGNEMHFDFVFHGRKHTVD